MVVGGLLNGSMNVYTVKGLKLVHTAQFHEDVVSVIRINRSGTMASIDLIGVMVISKFRPNTGMVKPCRFLYEYVGMKVISVDICRYDQGLLCIQADMIVDVRSLADEGKLLQRIDLSELSMMKAVTV